MSASPKGLVLGAVAIVFAAASCGSQSPAASTAAQADANAAAQIRASAERHRTETTDAQTTTAVTEPARRASTILTEADRQSFARLARQLPGTEGIAVTAAGTRAAVWVAGSQRSGVAWSTAKAPVAMAAISAGTARSADLSAAITASDNAAAERLWSGLGSGASAAAATTRQLRRAGDNRTITQASRLRPGYTAFGQTQWALSDQARFVAGMQCLSAGRKILALMGQVVPGQRWGLGSTGRPARFKGGWGPGISPGQGDGWLDRQMGLLSIDGVPLAIAIASTAPNHAQATTALSRIARWVAGHADARAAPRPACNT